ncbi:hypothetical protein HN51_017160 [Arachis hypogaea]|uniref:uncharacterized protein LOC110263854 n=1 Tax=Arachis ipaensis TaxID=130454 RepID=UPI000A2B8FCF|nr:uncharacterized protein LOC110263854 [Arachis ipaensis]QHN89031.1 Pectinesterase inhibitor [Arachis hypogaea]
MARHFNGNNVRPYSLILTLVFAFLLFDATSNAQKIVKVEEICNQTKIVAYCSNLLNSIPGGAARADVDSLAHYTIEVLRSKLKNTVNLLNSLIAKATDPKAKELYNFCLKEFTGQDGALAEIDPMQKSLKAKDYNDVSFHLNDLVADNDECMSYGQDQSSTSSHHFTTDFKDPSPLPQFTDDIFKVLQIITAISNYWFKIY